MKKIILYIIPLLFSFAAIGQRGGMHFAQNARTPEYNAWSNQLATKPSAKWTSALDLFMRKCIIHGNWLKLDRMWIFATETRANAKISIVNPTPASNWPTSITEVNTPAWTADSGYKGNNSTSYLNTNFNPSTQGVNLSLNSIFTSVYSRTQALQSSTGDFGAWNGTAYILTNCGNASNVYAAYLNDFSPSTLSNSNTLGCFTVTRTSSSVKTLYRNTTTIGTVSGSTLSIPSKNIYVCAVNNNGSAANFSPRQYSMFAIGGGNINATSFYNDFQAFATIIGFNK